ncbi:glycosyltransferase [Flavobacterium chuncheonense]|uniref:Glycosyltransferase n=1 Tax=Flavobacterium chuncheonense TaxID=2026653 RepID=A0ABW5YPR8_9FLAO
MTEIKSVLVANNHLDYFGGSETFTFALIEGLLAKGFDVEYFTFVKGNFSKLIEQKLNVGFMSKDSYDLVLANHNTCVRFLKDKGLVVQTCHGIYPDLEQPSIFADFHVAISQEVANYLAVKGFPSAIIMNGINTDRFYSKKALNDNLKSVLSLCHSESANSFLKDVCDELKVDFLCIEKFENRTWEIEDLINKSDMVVGLGRSAYEAMACGRPVIIYDQRPYAESFADGYVVDKLANSLVNNCSGRFYKMKMTKEMMVKEFKKYKKTDGEVLRNFIVDNLSMSASVDKYLALVNDCILNKDIIKKNTVFRSLKFSFGNSLARKFVKRFYKNYYKASV